ncbi:hypothetical protein BKA93DRAFT_880088 [Sparassis latifolia]
MTSQADSPWKYRCPVRMIYRDPRGRKRKREGSPEATTTFSQSASEGAYEDEPYSDRTGRDDDSPNHGATNTYVFVTGTQTLFISNLVHVPTCQEPGHGKIHIRLYIAGVKDAMNRAALLDAVDSQEHLASGSGDNHLLGNEDTDPSADERSRTPPRGPHRDAFQYHVALVHLHYGIYDSAVPATFIRLNLDSIESCSSLFREASSLPYGCFQMVLTSHIAEGGTGTVLGG